MRCCNFIYYAYYANVRRICRNYQACKMPCSIFRSAVIFGHLFLIEVCFFPFPCIGHFRYNAWWKRIFSLAHTGIIHH